MTIEVTSTIARAAGNGSTLQFNFSFKAFAATDLVVRDITDATGVAALKSYPTDYSVSLSPVGEGGSITFVTAPASGHTVDIRSLIPLVQPEDIRNQGRFLPEIHEGVFDTLERQGQDTRRLVNEAFRLPDNEATTPDWDTILSLANRKAKYGFFFNASTGAPELVSGFSNTAITQGNVGAALYPQTAAEIAAGVTPANYAYPPCNVRRYGAALDAVWSGSLATGTDDTVAFTNAIKVASAMGGGDVIYDGPTIIKNVPLLSFVNIRALGNATAFLNATAASDVHFNAQGTPGTAVPVTNNIAVGGLTANMANTSTFTVGGYAVLQTTGTSVPNDYVFYGGSPTYPTSNGRKQQIVRIESIVANVSVTFDTGVFESYTGGSCQLCPLNPVTYANATGAIIGFGIYNINARVSIGNNGGGVQIWYGIDFKIADNKITGASGYPGVRTIQSAYGEICSNRISDCQQVGAGLTTGIAHDIIESSHYIEVHHNKLSYLTEDEIGMRCWHCQFHHNQYLDAFDSGINTHGNFCFHIDIHDNIIICPNGSAGIALGYSSDRTQDSYITVARNRILNSGGKGISVANQGYTVTAISKAASAVVTINSAAGTNPLFVGDLLTLYAVLGMVEINGVAGTVTAIGGVSGAWTATLNINSTGFTVYSSGGVIGRASKGLKIIDNTIVGWKVTSGGTSPGISVQLADDAEIRGNYLDGATIGSAVDAGISCVNCARPQVTLNRVMNGTGAYGLQFVNCAGWEAALNTLLNNANQVNTSGSTGICLLHDNIASTTTNSIENNTPPTVRSYNNTWDAYGATNIVTVTYTSGVAMTFDASLGHRFELTINNNVAWTINAPLNPPGLAYGSRRITLVVRNTSGGALGASTFNAAFKMAAFTAPATGFSRAIEWEWNGSNWIESFRSANDVPN